MQIHGYGYRGKWYKSLNQAFGKMLGETEHKITQIPPIMEQELRGYIKRVTINVTDKFTPYQHGPNMGNRLQIRSGRSKRELRTRHSVTRVDTNKYNATFTGKVSGPHYLNIQEDGGTLVPHNSKYIAVPLPHALTSNGLPIKPSPKDWKNTFTKKSKKGNIIIFQKRGRKAVPLYVLKKSVTIRPRLRLAEGFDAAAPYFERKVLDAIDRQLMKV